MQSGARTKEEKKSKTYHVLIVEDEQVFGEYLEEVLQGHGYATVSFHESVKAADYFANNHENVDLVITDIVMPNMDGIELAKKIGKTRKDTPVILLSAYSEQLIDGASLPNVKAVLDKPVLRSDLTQAVEHVIPSHGNRRASKHV